MNLELQTRQKYSHWGAELRENKGINIANAASCENLKWRKGEFHELPPKNS